MSAAQEQRFLWLSAALVQAGLTSLLAEAATWMRTEEAVIADFSRGVTISDLGAALSLSNTQLNRLRAVIENLVPDTAPLPEIEVSLRDASSEKDECNGRDWKRSSPVDPEHSRTSELPSRSSAPPAPVLRPPPGPAPGQASPNQHLRWCAKHGKWRDPERTYRHSSGDFECSSSSRCKGAPVHSKPERKGAVRAPKSTSHQDSTASSRLPLEISRRGSSGSSRSPDRGHQRHKRKSPSGSAHSRHPSPKRKPLSSPRSIADSLFLTIDTNSMKLERTSDGYFKLKDLMKTWGRKHDLTTEDVLSAIADSLFKTMRNERRVNFLVFQEDEAGAEILLSVPDRSVR